MGKMVMTSAASSSVVFRNPVLLTLVITNTLLALALLVTATAASHLQALALSVPVPTLMPEENSTTTTAPERIFPLLFTSSTVRFYLFIRSRTGSEEIFIGQAGSIRKSHYSKQYPLKILIHGYKRNGFSEFPHFVKNAYMEHGPQYNIICVDWKRLASTSIYLNAAYSTRFVGEKVGELIFFLKDEGFISSLRDVHVVGFSLGAQVSGYMGKYVYAHRNQKVGRITGLDPAGPGFTGPDPADRLDMEDAEFVDVIHTSVKSGLAKAIGHADFFPNGGEHQPGCGLEQVVDPILGGCSHLRAVALFIETIRGVQLYGCSCASWSLFMDKKCTCRDFATEMALMGEHMNKKVRGTFFLKTDSAPPYILKHNAEEERSGLLGLPMSR